MAKRVEKVPVRTRDRRRVKPVEDEPCLSYSTQQDMWRVYRSRGNMDLEYVDTVLALTGPDAARIVAKKHWDFRVDGAEWDVLVMRDSDCTLVNVSFEPVTAVSR